MQNIQGRRTVSVARQRFGIGACAIVVLTAAAVADTVQADMFLKLDGIEGESVNARHSREIDVTGIVLPIVATVNTSATGSSRSGSTSTAPARTEIILPIVAPVPTFGTGSGKGKADCPSLTVFKNLDRASPILMKKLAQGVHIPQAVLTVQRSGAEQVDYYVLTMEEVFVSEVTQMSVDPSHLSDKVVFRARRYNFEYRVQNATGAPELVKFGWDCVTTSIT